MRLMRSALAGKPAPMSLRVDVPKLLAAYADLRPDPAVAAQRAGLTSFVGFEIDEKYMAEARRRLL